MAGGQDIYTAPLCWDGFLLLALVKLYTIIFLNACIVSELHKHNVHQCFHSVSVAVFIVNILDRREISD